MEEKRGNHKENTETHTFAATLLCFAGPASFFSAEHQFSFLCLFSFPEHHVALVPASCGSVCVGVCGCPSELRGETVTGRRDETVGDSRLILLMYLDCTHVKRLDLGGVACSRVCQRGPRSLSLSLSLTCTRVYFTCVWLSRVLFVLPYFAHPHHLAFLLLCCFHCCFSSRFLLSFIVIRCHRHPLPFHPHTHIHTRLPPSSACDDDDHLANIRAAIHDMSV